MAGIYDSSAPDQELNVRLNGDLPKKAAELQLNLPAVVEKAVADAVAQRQCELWLDANRKVQDAATDLFGNKERAVRWLAAPARAFGYKRPVDSEVSEVLDVIQQVKQGFCT